MAYLSHPWRWSWDGSLFTGFAERVLRACERGDSPSQIARRFEVSRVWVYQVWQRLKETGQRGSLRIGGYRRSRLADHDHHLRAWIKKEPDLTLAELCERLKALDVPSKCPHYGIG